MPHPAFDRFGSLCGVALCLALVPPAAMATNGLNLIGFGARTVALGGTGIAAADDTTTLNTNPAGLARIAHRQADIYTGVAFALDVAHADGFGNDRDVSNRAVPIAGGGYAVRLDGAPLVVGIGLFAQGGAGNVYKDLATPFGTRDELSGLFGIARLTPGLSWQPDDTWSLGASLTLNYAAIRQKVFPDTSFFNTANPARSFFGFEVKDARSIAWGYRLGTQYRPNDRLTLGATYAGKVRFPLEDGQLTADMRAIGLGKVTYRDARIEGLALAQEAGVGAAFRPARAWLIAAELRWLDWSHALKNSRLVARDPDHPAAPSQLENTARLEWRDQYVLALGVEYQWDDATALRAGYNHGRNPIPRKTTNPLLAGIGERHLTFGMTRRLTAEWDLATGVEYLLGNAVTYTNPELPFGPGAQERTSYVGVNLMLSRRW